MLTRWPLHRILLPTALLASAFFARPAAAEDPPALILSEVLADPAVLPDAQGEFLELGNPGEDTARLDGVALSVETQTFALGALRLPPSACFLVCRDSAAYARVGIACDRGWTGMTLANGRPLEAGLSWPGGNFRATVPASRPGTSWENTWDAAAGFAVFQPSLAGRAGVDSATPGTRNSRSVRPAARNLGLSGIEVSSSSVRVTVVDFGSGAPPPPSRIVVRLDADWDGIAETTLDSVPLDPSRVYPAALEFRIPAGTRGRVSAALGPDEAPADNVLSAALEPRGGPLAFGAFQAAGRDGAPEWIEVRNVTAAGGQGRRIALAMATVGAMALGAKAGSLDAGERVILASDTAAFRDRYGPIKARLLRPEPWRSLRNSGDTLVLALAGAAVDTVSWTAIKPGAPAVGNDGPPVEAGWTLSGRVAFPDAPLDVEVRAPEGADYVLRAFNLEGDVVREIGRGGAGRRAHAWDGRGAGGRALPKGPYVLCLTFGDGRTRKRAVVAGER